MVFASVSPARAESLRAAFSPADGSLAQLSAGENFLEGGTNHLGLWQLEGRGVSLSPEQAKSFESRAIGTNGQNLAGASITLSLGSGAGNLGGTLSRSTDANGIAHFNDLSLDEAGPKTLTASALVGSASPTNSSSFMVIGQVAALATLEDLPYYRANFRRIVATREWLSRELTRLGFRVLPSRTNFILARPPIFAAKDWLRKLRQRKVLVRWFSAPETRDYLRITIGTPDEAHALVEAAQNILRR